MSVTIAETIIDGEFKHTLDLNFLDTDSWTEINVNANYSKSIGESISSETVKMQFELSHKQEEELYYLLSSRKKQRERNS